MVEQQTPEVGKLPGPKNIRQGYMLIAAAENVAKGVREEMEDVATATEEIDRAHQWLEDEAKSHPKVGLVVVSLMQIARAADSISETMTDPAAIIVAAMLRRLQEIRKQRQAEGEGPRA